MFSGNATRFLALLCLVLITACSALEADPPMPTSSDMGLAGFGFGPEPREGEGGKLYWLTQLELITEGPILKFGETKLGPKPKQEDLADVWQEQSRELEIRVDKVLAVRPDLKAKVAVGDVLKGRESSNRLCSQEELKKAFSSDCFAVWRYFDGWQLLALGQKSSLREGPLTFEVLVERQRQAWAAGQSKP